MMVLGTVLGATRILVRGVDFQCNTTLCYGIGPTNDATFKALQRALNRYPGVSVGVDGKLGAGSVSAMKKAAAWILKESPSLYFGAPALGIATTKENLAIQAEFVKAALTDIANKKGLKTPTTTPKPSGGGTPTSTPQEFEEEMEKQTSSNALWWGLGALAVVGAGAVGYTVWQRRR